MNSLPSDVSPAPAVITQPWVHAASSSSLPATNVTSRENESSSTSGTRGDSGPAPVAVTLNSSLAATSLNYRKSSVSSGADGLSSDSRTNSSPLPLTPPFITGKERSPSWWLKYREDIAHALEATLNLVADVVEGFPVANAVLKLAATGVNRLEVCLLLDIPKTLLIYSSRQVGRMKRKQLTSLASLPSS
jgi:hypothetical protein